MMSRKACRLAALATVFLFAGCSGSTENLFRSPAKEPVVGPGLLPAGASSKATWKVTQPPSAEEEKPAAAITQIGSGTFVQGASSHTAGRAGADRAEGGEVTLNFNDAPLQEVLEAVLGQILQVNYTIDPTLQARVTMQTSRPIAQSQVLPTLEGVLQASGIALVRGDGMYKAVPLSAAAQSAPAASAGAFAGTGQGGYGLQVIPLRFASARQLQKLLEPFVPSGGVLQVDDGRNLLMLSGTRPDIAAFTRLVSIFDVDWLRGMSFGLVPLKQGNAVPVAQEITAILGSGGDGPLTGIMRVVPISRINSILLVSGQPAYIQQAKDWIERLDNGTDESAPRIYVYNVQNSRASDVAKVLSEMFGTATQSSQPATLPGAGISRADSGAPAAAPIQGGMNGAASPAGSGSLGSGAITGSSAVSAQDKMGNAAVASAPAGQNLPTIFFGTGNATADRPQTRIVADEKNNALVILAQPREYRMIEQALKQLDVLPQQVMIEATIAEVTLNDDLRYGVQWFLKNGRVTSILSDAANSQLAALAPGFGQVLATGNTQVILSALSAVTNVNVVSAPQLMVLDHQTAVLQVGDEVPIAVQQARSVVNPDAPIVNTLQLRSTGVILKVTPRVNANGIATLEIEQEVSDVARTTTSNIDSPTIQQRRIRSVVAAADNQTIALGGLIRENRTRSKSGVPILSDIPVLGNLVSTTSNSTSRTELLILLTPRVIHNPDEARAVTEELQQRMQGLQPISGARP